MKRLVLSLLFAGLCLTSVEAQQQKAQQPQKKVPHAVRTCPEITARRTEIYIPQVKGYNVYKGDFHVHTSYSDGRVNPAGRVTEAWMDGLDIVAITDHYEGQRNLKNVFKATVPYNESGEPTKYLSAFDAKKVMVDFNAIHREAEKQLEKSGYPMLLVKGCEMARNAKTHGHFNCIFVDDPNTLYDQDLKVAFKRVHEQGGIVIHNHPSYKRGTTDKSEWHTEVYNEGLIDGIEVANGYSYYPLMVGRCLDEKLIMFGNTDEHGMTAHKYAAAGNHRTMTFVFAKELTEKAVKDALLKRRTLVYSGGNVIGEEKLLTDLLNASVECRLVSENLKDETRTYTLTNRSSVTYRLRRGKTIYELEPYKPIICNCSKNKKTGKYNTPKFTVENMYHVDYKNLVVDLEIDK